MVHGLPDWGLRGPKATTYGLDDLGEAVVRLGSPVVWDRRGDVVVLEDFEGSAATYVSYGHGAGNAHHRSCAMAHNGAFGLSLIAGSNLEQDAGVELTAPCLVAGPCGFEGWFSVHPDLEWVELSILYYDGTMLYRASLQYHHDLETLGVWVDGGVEVTIDDDVALYWGVGCNHVMKIVGDFATHEYVRGILDNHAYNLQGIPIFHMGVGFDPFVTARLVNHGVVTTNPEIFVDDLILTQNEPVSI